MNIKNLTRAGAVLVAGAAAFSIFNSQRAFAQGEAETGFSALIGRERIRPDDPRFQPAAALVLHEADAARLSGSKQSVVFSDKILVDYVSRYLVFLPDRLFERGTGPRTLTASETALLEELFTHNLSKARSAEISRTGFSGSIGKGDVEGKPDDLIARAKARAGAKSKWYSEGAQGLGPG
jgi:hypothetical protein